MHKNKSVQLAIFIVLGVLLVDQATKIWSYFVLREETEMLVLGHWFRLHYVENPGMAFGITLGGESGKLFLTVFRVILSSALAWYFLKQIRLGATKGAVWCYALIFAGAIGNIFDSFFYGFWFDNAVGDGGALFPFGYGKVIDMIYFPLYQGILPDWVPFKGGEYFEFFEPVFNIADSAISVGIGLMFLFQKRFFPEKSPLENQQKSEKEAN
jgi:signal peptidase II